MMEINVTKQTIYTLEGLTKEDIRFINWCLETSDNAINPELKVRRTNIMDVIEKITEMDA